VVVAVGFLLFPLEAQDQRVPLRDRDRPARDQAAADSNQSMAPNGDPQHARHIFEHGTDGRFYSQVRKYLNTPDGSNLGAVSTGDVTSNSWAASARAISPRARWSRLLQDPQAVPA
jgi:hypothetical protein